VEYAQAVLRAAGKHYRRASRNRARDWRYTGFAAWLWQYYSYAVGTIHTLCTRCRRVERSHALRLDRVLVRPGGLSEVYRLLDMDATRTAQARCVALKNEWPSVLRRVPAGRSRSPGRITVVTIVRYTNQVPPKNAYPREIISPTRSGPYCFRGMEDLGDVEQVGQWSVRYRRCRPCGFTVRTSVRFIFDAASVATLRRTLVASRLRYVGG
jgi:hypothetical protein